MIMMIFWWVVLSVVVAFAVAAFIDWNHMDDKALYKSLLKDGCLACGGDLYLSLRERSHFNEESMLLECCDCSRLFEMNDEQRVAFEVFYHD